MSQVLDSYAVFAYLEKEAGYEKVRDALTHASETGHNLSMTTVNWGEVYYIVRREQGEKKADEVIQILDSFPLDVVEVTQEIAHQAGVYKAHKKMAYADCFAAALAKINKTALLTGDKEFKEVQDEIKIQWL